MTIEVQITKKFRDPDYYKSGTASVYTNIAQAGGGGTQNDTYAPFVHIHVISDIQSLQTELDTLASDILTHTHDSPAITDGTYTYSLIADATKLAVHYNNSNIDVLKIYANGDLTATRYVSAVKFIVSNGTSSQFLKADGSLDSTTYAPLDVQGQILIETTPDQSGFSYGIFAYAYGAEAYGIVGCAEKLPLLGVNLSTSGTIKRHCLAMRSDSAHLTPQNGLGLNLIAYMPVLGWVDPKYSEREGGYVSFVLEDVTQDAESVGIEFWTLRAGVMTKQASLSSAGVWQAYPA